MFAKNLDILEFLLNITEISKKINTDSIVESSNLLPLLILSGKATARIKSLIKDSKLQI
jgi:hypothetical protein